MSLKERLKENSRDTDINDLKTRILQEINVEKRVDVEDYVKDYLNNTYDITLDKYERDKLITDIVKELNGYGALDNLIDDDSVTAVFVNSYDSVFVEKNDKVYKTKIILSNLEKIVERMVSDCGETIDYNNPVFEGMLPSGARVNIIMPPYSKNPALTIKKYSYKNANMGNLVNTEFMNEDISKFLMNCVKAKKNIIINGLSNSGRTTLVNALISEVSNDERVAVVEDFSEILLTHDNFITCKNKKNVLETVIKMMPDRVIIDTCHDIEQIRELANSGFKGIIATVSLSDSIDINVENSVIVKVKKVLDGTRKIISVSDKTEIFRYRECFIEDETMHGEFETVSKVPKYKEEIVPVIKNLSAVSSRLKENLE
ncbi:CpaF family protein [bacterium]|nr:CpaF family protein [bacterium]